MATTEHNVGVESTNLSWSTTLKPRREGRGEPTKEVEWDGEGPTNKKMKTQTKRGELNKAEWPLRHSERHIPH